MLLLQICNFRNRLSQGSREDKPLLGGRIKCVHFQKPKLTIRIFSTLEVETLHVEVKNSFFLTSLPTWRFRHPRQILQPTDVLLVGRSVQSHDPQQIEYLLGPEGLARWRISVKLRETPRSARERRSRLVILWYNHLRHLPPCTVLPS